MKGFKYMKIRTNRIISLLTALCLLIAVVPVVTGLTVRADDPELSTMCETVIDRDGKDTDFGASSSSLRINTRIKFSEARDFSDFDTIKLDIYIENYTALKNFLSESQQFLLCFGSQKIDSLEKQKRFTADISSQIKKTGWNGITVKISDFTGNGTWSSIWRINLAFSDESIANLSSDLKETDIRYMNICDVFSAPSITDSGALIFGGFVSNTIGENASSLVADTKYRFGATVSADISGYDIIKADLFIPDHTAYTAFLNGKELAITFSSQEGSAVATIPDVYYPISSAPNWYTVLFATSGMTVSGSFDPKKVTGVKLGFEGESGSVVGDAFENQFGFTNLRGFSYDMSASDNTIGEKTADIGTKKAAVVLGHNYNSIKLSANGSFGAIKDAEYIEFDLYISNAANIRSAFSTDDSLSLQFTKQGTSLVFKDIEKQIDFDGKNHIVLPVSSAQNNGFDKNSSFEGISIDAFVADPTAQNPAAGEFIIAGNLIATKYANNSLKFDKIADITDKIDASLGETFGDSSCVKNISATDISGVKYVEFDIYVQNFSSLKAQMAAMGITDAKLSLSSSSGSVGYGVFGDIAGDGWNHLAIPYSRFAANESGTFSLSSVLSCSFSFVGETANPTGLIEGQKIVIRNVAATKVTDPTLPENAQAVISENGKFGIFGDTYGNVKKKSVITFDPPIDATVGSRLEFDFYIDDVDNFKKMISASSTPLYLALGTSTEKEEAVALYNISNKVTEHGWNHIELDAKNFTSASGDDTPDLSTVRFAYLTFLNNTSANQYAGLMYEFKNIIICSDPIDTPPAAPDYPLMISREGIGPKAWGDKYSWTRDRLCFDFRSDPLDISEYDYIGFDIFIRDYDAFKSAVSGKRINFVLASSDSKTTTRKLYDFEEQIKGSGWNHIVIPMESKWFRDSSFTESSVKWIMINFQDGGSEANPIGSTLVRIANLGVDFAEYSKLPPLPKYKLLISEKGSRATTWGDKYSWAIDRVYVNLTENPVDLTDVDQIEFDIYIADYDEFKSGVAGKRINFCLASSDKKTSTRIRFDFENQITKSGWNHIILDKGARWQVDSGFTYTAVKWVLVGFQDGGSEPNPMKNTVVKIANICGCYAPYRYNPELPDNVVAQLGKAEDGTDSRVNTVGNYFHYTLDKIYREKLSPVDFSQTPIIEFDIYVSDYEKFLAAENDPNDKQNSKLSLQVSSTPPALWGQYNSPRSYYSSELLLAPYIKHSGWNHISVGKSEFTVHNHGVDWSALTAYVVYYHNSSNLYPYKNANSDLLIKVANIVNTGIVAHIPKNPDSDPTPDKSAVYISSVEGLSDENGTWNIQSPILSTDYKTAGKESLLQKATYKNDPEDTAISYIFDTTADMSDLKTLKFDFLIDFPQILNKPNNNLEICLSNSRLNFDDCYRFKIDTSKLKQGWNSISLDLKTATKNGTPDLSAVKVVVLRFTKLDLSSESYEEIIYGIDNLRYISSTGNKTLKVAAEDEEFDDSFDFDDDFDDDLPELDEDEASKASGRVKHQRIIKRYKITDWLIGGIIMAAEALVVAAGVFLFILIYSKKKKKRV